MIWKSHVFDNLLLYDCNRLLLIFFKKGIAIFTNLWYYYKRKPNIPYLEDNLYGKQDQIIIFGRNECFYR